MQEIALDFPIRGLVESSPTSKQPGGSADEAINLRAIDPESGRVRGGTREGVTRQSLTQINGADVPVRQLAVVQYDRRGSTYTQYAEDAEVEEWAKETPLKQDCRAVQIDLGRNRLCLDGRAGVALKNAAGELVWKFVLPVGSQEHICRALAVDESGAFYVAVSEGHPQTSSKLWKYRPGASGASSPNKEWEITVGAFVERLRLREGLLFAACNYPDRGAAEIRVYRLIDTAAPEVAWVREQVPYPINALDVRAKDGAILTCHELNATRAYDRRSADTQRRAIDWTPERLVDYDKRKWCTLDASDIDGDGSMNSAYASGDGVSLWRDLTGNGRDLYSIDTLGTPPPGVTDPTLNKSKSFGGYDTVLFQASTTVGNTANALASLPNTSTDDAYGNSQRSTLPGYVDAWFAAFIVLRVSNDAFVGSLMGQIETSASADMAMFINANDSNGAGLPPTTDAGSAWWYVRSALAGNGTSGQPNAADYDNTTNFVLLTVVQKNDGSASGSTFHVMGDEGAEPGYTAPVLTYVGSTQFGRFGATGPTDVTAFASVFGLRGEIAEVRVLRDYLNSSGVKTIVTTDERRRMEGYLAWKYGFAHRLDSGHAYMNAPPTDDPLPGGSTSAYATLTDTEAMLVKWDPNKARPRAILKDDTTGTGIGGLGYECLWPQNGETDYCFSSGPMGTGTGGTAAQILTRQSVVRRVKDNGDSFSHTGSGTFEARWGAGVSPTYHYPKGCVSGIAANSDPENLSAVYLFLPVYTATAPATDALYIYLQSGTAAGTGVETPELRTITLDTGARGYACAVERFLPEYFPGVVISTIDQYVTIGTPQEGSDTEAISNVRLVAETRANLHPRGVFVAAAAGAGLRYIAGAGTVAVPSGAPTLVGGNVVSIVDAYERLWIADGVGYWRLDPRSANGIVREWKSKTAGTLPKNCRLLAYQGERLWLARGEEPEFIFGTAIGDPFNADLVPDNPSESQAVRVPVGEPVNALVPLRDDLMLVGTQTRIMRLTGNPARGGGLDRLGDVQGTAFGEPWCKDPDGRTYVFGSRGGVFVTDGLGMVPISDAIRRRLEDIDLNLYFLRLVWNWRAQALMVFLIPQGTPGTTTTAYVWDRTTNSWWQDEYPFAVTSVRLVDGDRAGGRAVWMGCGDGWVRRVDELVALDDGALIRWRVVGGPIHSRSERTEVMVARPRFTLAGAEGCHVELFASSDSERPGAPTASAVTEPGLGDAVPIRARGANVWWRVRGTGRVAFEGGSALVEEMGVRRRMLA